LGFVTTFLSLVVLLPIAALVWTSGKHGRHEFWTVVSAPEAVAALKLTLGAAVIVSALNAVLGTITAWVLVRDDFAGKSLMNAVIDLPFALSTVERAITLLYD
jgi:sulfate transport system permease protein